MFASTLAGLRFSDGERLRIEMTATVPAFLRYDQHAEMIREHWKKIGIEGVVVARQLIEWSRDGGVNWHESFHGIYVRHRPCRMALQLHCTRCCHCSSRAESITPEPTDL